MPPKPTSPLPQTKARSADIIPWASGATSPFLVIADPPRRERLRKDEGTPPQFFLLSAHSRAALSELAGRYAERLERASAHELQIVAAASAHRRDLLPNRLAVTARAPDDIVAALK